MVQLFRNRPALAPELLRDALRVKLPRYTDVSIDSAEFTQVQPAEYRADLVIQLLRGKPKLGIVVEVQRSSPTRKRFVWPAYVTHLRARIELPVCLLVIATTDAVARWAAKPIELGGSNQFTPLVLGPAGIPEITDEDAARADPELAVLSAVAHGFDPDSRKAARIAAAAHNASNNLDEERSQLYSDLVLAALSAAARQELQAMDLATYEYQSAFAKRCVAKGRAEGKAEGRAALLTRQLTLRFGPLPADAVATLGAASIKKLDAIGERLLGAKTLGEALCRET